MDISDELKDVEYVQSYMEGKQREWQWRRAEEQNQIILLIEAFNKDYHIQNDEISFKELNLAIDITISKYESLYNKATYDVRPDFKNMLLYRVIINEMKIYKMILKKNNRIWFDENSNLICVKTE